MTTVRSRFLTAIMVFLFAAFVNPHSGKAEAAFNRAYDLLISGKREDLIRATTILEEAHKSGDIRASFAIGTLLKYGHGYNRDQALALEWFEHAADRGLDAAALAAADIRSSPKTDESLRNTSVAAKYALQAAESGSADAMALLAGLHWRGYGVAKDKDRALRLLHASVELGNSGAFTWLSRMYRDGEVGIDTRAIVKGLRPLAKKGDPSAQAKLARYLYSGWNIPHERSEAEALYLAAANAGQSSAQFTLCKFASRDRRPKEAFEWCLKAAKQDHVDAMLRLADFYIRGAGTRRDLTSALHLSWSAAFFGSRKALQYIDIAYREIAKDRRQQREAAQRAKRNELIMGFIGHMLTTPAPDDSVYRSQQWKNYQQNQRQLQRQVNELSAIGWSGL